MTLYPLLMSPAFQHGSDTPWGGTMLRDIFMKDAPNGPTGASLEVSVQPGLESLVGNGHHAGKTLSAMAALWGEALTGQNVTAFPLLIKFLDTQQPLSVQVCPENCAAWVILNAEPGAKIAYGLAEGCETLQAGREEACLNWVSVRPGDVFYIPAGMVHALGAGIQCYELRDADECSCRLWDWNRGRALHTEKALEALRPELRLNSNEGTTALCRGGSRTYYVSDSHIELCRLNLSGHMPLESGRMLLLTALSPCRLQWPEGEIEIAPFATVLIPAALEGAALTGHGKLLMGSLPDQNALRLALADRAENVSGIGMPM